MMGIVHGKDNVCVDSPINPCMVNNKFSGRWVARVMGSIVHIVLFKGKTSSVDYMLFAGQPDTCTSVGSAEDALCILESTKTSDKESRNTAVNQRIIKFTTYFRIYPRSTAIPVMFWLNATWTLQKLTDTAILGFKMMTTLGIRLFMNSTEMIIDMNDVLKMDPFINFDEMISFKNNMTQKKGNVSVRIEHKLRIDVDTGAFTNLFEICIKLDQGISALAGKVSHDPNAGLLSGLMNTLDKLAPGSQYLVTNHGVLQPYFDKCPNSKLWHSIHGMRLEFDNVEIKATPPLPTSYFVVEKCMTEKLATILCQMTSAHRTIFTNHGGCALTAVACPDGRSTNVGRTMTRPDILFADSCKKELILVEGKIEADIHKGVVQLGSDHLAEFIEMIQREYPDYTIRRGLCVTIDNIKNITKYDGLAYPVLFALDAFGDYIDLR